MAGTLAIEFSLVLPIRRTHRIFVHLPDSLFSLADDCLPICALRGNVEPLGECAETDFQHSHEMKDARCVSSQGIAVPGLPHIVGCTEKLIMHVVTKQMV